MSATADTTIKHGPHRIESTAHTPEPWVRDAAAGMECDVRAANGRKVALCFGLDQRSANTAKGRALYRAVCDANAHRIVVCVNACQGIPTDMLEQVGRLIVPGALPHHELTTRLAKVRNALTDEIDGGEECRGRDQMLSRLIRMCDGEAI